MARVEVEESLFFSSAQWWTWGSVFTAKDAFGSVYIAVMSCWKQRPEGNGVGYSATIAVKAAKVVDEDDDEDSEWIEDDDDETDGGSWSAYKKPNVCPRD